MTGYCNRCGEQACECSLYLTRNANPCHNTPMKLGVFEAAARLGKSPRTLARWRAQGIGPFANTDGRRVYYDTDDLERWKAGGRLDRTPDKDWDRFHTDRSKAGQVLRWPDEEVVREAYAWSRAGLHQVADVQCGAGRHTALLYGLGLDVVGYDLSEVAVAQARELYPSCRFEVRDARSLRLADQSLDAVLCWRSLHVFGQRDAQQVLRGLCRALKPNGRLLLSTRSRRNLYRDRPEVYPRELSRRELHRLLQDAGFVQVEIDLSERTYDGGRYRDSWWVARARRGGV